MHSYNIIMRQKATNPGSSPCEMWRDIVPNSNGSSVHILESDNCFEAIGKFYIQQRPACNSMLC